MSVIDLGKEWRTTATEQKNMKTELIKPGNLNTRFLFGLYRLRFKTEEIKIEQQVLPTNGLVFNHPTRAGLDGSNQYIGEGDVNSWTNIETINSVQPVTDVGKIECAKWLDDSSGNYPNYMAVGLGTTAYAVSNTTLYNEKNRDVVTITDNTTATMVYERIIKSTDGAMGSTIYEAGLLNESSGGELFTRYKITALSFSDTKNYRIKIKAKFEDATNGRGIWTTAGLNEMRSWASGKTAGRPTHCAWGTGTTTPAISDTTLTGEVKRKSFISSNRADNRVTYQSLLDATTAIGQDLYNSGLFNSASNGDLFVEQKYAKIEKSNLFNVGEYDNIEVI